MRRRRHIFARCQQTLPNARFYSGRFILMLCVANMNFINHSLRVTEYLKAPYLVATGGRNATLSIGLSTLMIKLQRSLLLDWLLVCFPSNFVMLHNPFNLVGASTSIGSQKAATFIIDIVAILRGQNSGLYAFWYPHSARPFLSAVIALSISPRAGSVYLIHQFLRLRVSAYSHRE